MYFFNNSLDISGCCDITILADESNEEVTEYLREKKITRSPETTTINDENRKPEFKIKRTS